MPAEQFQVFLDVRIGQERGAYVIDLSVVIAPVSKRYCVAVYRCFTFCNVSADPIINRLLSTLPAIVTRRFGAVT